MGVLTWQRDWEQRLQPRRAHNEEGESHAAGGAAQPKLAAGVAAVAAPEAADGKGRLAVAQLVQSAAAAKAAAAAAAAAVAAAAIADGSTASDAAGSLPQPDASQASHGERLGQVGRQPALQVLRGPEGKATSPESVVAWVRDSYRNSSMSELARNSFGNSLDQISTGLYGKDLHFVLELVQNA
eukprot:187128-Chlamydomonas_euryale.AAC.3